MLQLLEDFVMLGVDGLHRFGVAALVRVVLHRQAAVLLLEFVKAADVNKVFHVFMSFLYVAYGSQYVYFLESGSAL